MTHDIAARPILLAPLFADFPSDLKSVGQWVLWRLVLVDDEWKKIPYMSNGKPASSTDSATWSTFDVTVAAYQRGSFDGVGFVVTQSAGVVGIDIDKVATHKHHLEVRKILETILESRTYVERSPGGGGFRAFIRGKLPFRGKNNRKLGVELYAEVRFLTVTGHHVPDTGTSIVSSQNAIDEIVGIAFPPVPLVPQAQRAVDPTAAVKSVLPDAELLERARTASNAPKFDQLWAGRWQEAYASQSEADLALCALLAFWTRKDPAQIDRLFRQTGLMRSKWDEVHGANTYGENTIAKALGMATNVYTPPSIKSSGLEVVSLDKVVPQQLEWLWPGFFPLGKVSLLSGNPGLGKSQITLDMAARVSTGAPWPTGEIGKRGRVILVSGEDDPADTIVPRLNAVGADLRRIKLIAAAKEIDANGKPTLRTLSLERDLERIGALLQQTRDVALIVIDPISAHLGKIDSHNNAETRALMEPLSRMAQVHRVAVLLVSHLNKGSGEAMYRTAGSIAFVAAARASFAVMRDDASPGHRLMLPIKTNLAPDSRGVGYEVKEGANKAPYVVWDAQTIASDDIESLMQQSLPGEGEKLREAMDWLQNKLSTGPMPAAQLVRDAKKDGVADRTLDRAKKKLGVKAMKNAVAWVWHLPPAQPAQSPQSLARLQPVPTTPRLYQLGPAPDWVRTFPFRNL